MDSINILINGKFILAGQGDPVEFYLITGLGPDILIAESMTITDTDPNFNFSGTVPSATETDFVLRLGLGIDIRLSKSVYLSVESDALETFASNDFFSHEPANIDISLFSVSLFSLGLKINLL